MTLLSFDKVSSGYGKSRIVNALSLEIAPGDRLAILGRNGVGKTTFVNTFLGIAALHEGAIALNGARRARVRHYDAARAGISVVPQGRGILPSLTVKENLLLGAAVGRKGRWDLKAVFDLFPILRERSDQPGTALSGGQQQMLAIGRALMANPALLVVDEPSEGLAPVIIDELAEVFNVLTASGTTLLVIEQNYSLVRRTTDRYCVFSKGSIVEDGRTQELTMENLKKHVAV